MRDEVDLSLTIPSKLLGKRDREQKNCEEEKNKNKKAKKQQKDPILLHTSAATHKFLPPPLTMPYSEIGDDFRSLDFDHADVSSDLHLTSSSSVSSFSSSSSSLFSAAGTDDPSPKMEKDPRKIARRFDFFSSLPTLFIARIIFGFALLPCLRFCTDGILSILLLYRIVFRERSRRVFFVCVCCLW